MRGKLRYSIAYLEFLVAAADFLVTAFRYHLIYDKGPKTAWREAWKDCRYECGR